MAQHKIIDPADFEYYEDSLNKFLSGELDANSFLHTRLHLGVYNQRQDGMCMVRTKLPGGKMSAKQLMGFAECIEQYSIVDDAQITTRQDIQFHYIPLKKTPALQRHLAKFDIATREAAGNTVRNITACQFSGVCPAQHTDIQPYVDQAAQFFVRHPLTQSLPRKFKISFSACEQDCAQGLIHDLAVIATRQNNQPGFKVLVGGGLGAKPIPAVELVDYLTVEDLIPAIEAVLILHDRHSDRKRRTRNRIKFLVDRMGIEQFKEQFKVEFERTRSVYDEPPLDVDWREPSIKGTPLGEHLNKPLEQYQSGLLAVPIFVRNGDLTNDHFRQLAKLLEDNPNLELRTNQDQNLTLFNVPSEQIVDIVETINAMGLKMIDGWSGVISCPGTSTCPLGITNSDRLGQIVQSRGAQLNVRINGCQNSCANSSIADIGFYGKGVRHNGTLVPSYKLQLSGNGRYGGEFAFDGPQIPAARIPKAIELISNDYQHDKNSEESFFDWSRRKGSDHFQSLLKSLATVRNTELPFLVRDVGDNNTFQVQSMGVGECAGAQINPITKLFMEAKYEADLSISFANKYKYDDAVESLLKRVYLLNKALFLKLDHQCEAADLSAQLVDLKSLGFVHISENISFESFVEQLEAFQRQPDEQNFPQLEKYADAWLLKVEAVEDSSKQSAGH